MVCTRVSILIRNYLFEVVLLSIRRPHPLRHHRHCDFACPLKRLLSVQDSKKIYVFENKLSTKILQYFTYKLKAGWRAFFDFIVFVSSIRHSKNRRSKSHKSMLKSNFWGSCKIVLYCIWADFAKNKRFFDGYLVHHSDSKFN